MQETHSPKDISVQPSESSETLANTLPEKTEMQRFADLAKSKMEEVLPRHMDGDRMIRIFFGEIRKNPALANCDRESFITALVKCSELGLEPGSSLGFVYLIPFRNKKANRMEVQVMPSYKGLIELVYRSGRVSTLVAHVVYENDEFDYMLGTDSFVRHKPVFGNRGNIRGVYAVAKLKDGTTDLELMPREEIEAVRATSKSKEGNIWRDNYGEMAKKTVLRRIIKRLPVSTEDLRKATLEVAT